MQQLNILPEPSRRPLELRDYQRQMKLDIYQLIKQGTNRILVYGPTGSGKTLVLSSVIQDALSRGRRCLLLVHRDFLVEQTHATLLNLGVDAGDIGIIKAGYQEDRARPLQIAGLQSLNNRSIPDDIGLIVADECHSVAFWSGYQRVKESAPAAIQLGFTASPWRLKPHIEYFGMHYDAIVKGPSIKELIKKKHLSKVKCYGWGGIVSYKKFKPTREGEFSIGQMEQEFIAAKIPEFVVAKIEEFAEGRTGIVFNSGCRQSQIQTDLLNKAGIPTAHVDGNTPAKERQRVYAQLERGEIRCISSVGCLTEGFDVRSMSFIVLARATKSRALYVQMCGRGLRSFPGKENCLILDMGNNVNRLGHLTSDWKIKLEKEEVNQGMGGIPEAAEEINPFKECPTCGALCHTLVKICPDCGYIFPPKKIAGDVFKKKFGELLDPETKEMVDYARSQRRTRFTKNQSPDKLWSLFKERYGQGAILKKEWLEDACFNEGFPLGNEQRFLDYLEKWISAKNKKPEKYLQHHVKIEFPQCDLFGRFNHWELLNVDKQSDLLQIRAAYQKAVKLVEDDGEQIDLLNWAFDKAMNEKLGINK